MVCNNMVRRPYCAKTHGNIAKYYDAISTYYIHIVRRHRERVVRCCVLLWCEGNGIRRHMAILPNITYNIDISYIHILYVVRVAACCSML